MSDLTKNLYVKGEKPLPIPEGTILFSVNEEKGDYNLYLRGKLDRFNLSERVRILAERENLILMEEDKYIDDFFGKHPVAFSWYLGKDYDVLVGKDPSYEYLIISRNNKMDTPMQKEKDALIRTFENIMYSY